MDAFVAAILLRLTGFDEFREDAHANPPGGERGETDKGVRGEGNAVVGADPIGEAIFFEQAGEDGFGAENSRGMESLATGEITAEAVGDGEGEAIFTLPGLELAFEISGPEVVWGEDRAGGFAWVGQSGDASGEWDHAAAFEDILNRGTSRQIPSWVLAIFDFEKLLSTPSQVTAAELEEDGGDLGIGLVRGMNWPSAGVFDGMLFVGELRIMK